MKKIRSQSGIISLFVLIAMLFLLIFIFSIYQVVISKKKEQDTQNIELKQMYSKTAEEVDEFLYAEDDEIIPIYNINELNIVGTGEYIEIKNKIYRCGSSNAYKMKNNIFVDIKENLKTANMQPNDYKLYSSNIFIDKSIYDLYYYYEFGFDTLWKNIAYQKFTEEDKTLVTNGTYLRDKFSIINSFNYPNKTILNFMMIWSDNKGKLSNIEILSQDISIKKINSLNDINVFNKNFGKINKETGEFYIFVNVENNI